MESKAAKKDTDSVYSGYYDYSEPAAKMAGHRILAVDRGEREGFLKVSVTVDAARAVRLLTAVSYTHLDVYKRQGKYNIKAAAQCVQALRCLAHTK